MDGTISLLGEFKNRTTEHAFRRYSLDHTRLLTLIIGIAVLIGSLTFIWNDFASPTPDTTAAISRAVQVVCAGIGVSLVYYLTSWRSIYAASYLLGTSLLGAMLVVGWSRPPDYLLHLGMDTLLTLGVYVVLPTVTAQVLLGWAYTAGLLVLHFTIKQPLYELAHLTVPASLIAANFTGLVVSAFYNRSRRITYVQMLNEQSVRMKLEQAQAEIEQLTQLIPMCAACKKVRNDAGYWEQVEVFMQQVSGGKVSHGMCPQCADRWLQEAGIEGELDNTPS